MRGRTRAYAPSTARCGAVVAASGLTGGDELPATVMPFILRAAPCSSASTNGEFWARLGSGLRPTHLEQWSTAVALDDIGPVFERVLAGRRLAGQRLPLDPGICR